MDIAYFNYMEDCEKKQTLKNRSGENYNGSVGVETTQRPEYEAENNFSDNTPPTYRKNY